MSRIIVFGGHGRIALLLAPLLVARGDEVTAVIRNPQHIADVEATGARPLVADIESLDVAAIANLIREGKTHQVRSALQAGRQFGMQTMDQHLAELVNTGVSSYGQAAEKAQDMEEFKRLVHRSDAAAMQ